MAKHHSKLSKKIGNIGSKQRQQIEKAAKHPFEAIKNITKGAAEHTVFLPLTIFKPMMIATANKNGGNLKKSDPMHTIALGFVNRVIAPKHTHLEHADSDVTNILNTAEQTAGTAYPPAGMALKIVHFIIDFIRGNQKKATATDKGEAIKVAPSNTSATAIAPTSTVLTPDEAAAAGTSTPTADDKAIAKASNVAQDELAKKVPGSVDSKGKVHGHSKILDFLRSFFTPKGVEHVENPLAIFNTRN